MARATAELLRLNEFSVQGGHLAWPARTVSFERVTLRAAAGFAGPRPTTTFRLADALARRRTRRGDRGIARTPSACRRRSRPAAAAIATAPAGPAATAPWSVQVAAFDVTDGRVDFDDRGVEPAASAWHQWSGGVGRRLTLADGATMPFKLSFNVDGGGAVGLDGTLTAIPSLRVESKVRIDALALNVVNPYLLAETYLQLPSGALTIDGQVLSERR